ncbi:transcriptional regulator [Flavobacterium silvisoli]|uniref:Transcriptional regulator n=1 Tax=Flavobacterium silvisoli TaxID=2529433 RepID=A0A4Q9YVR5_9FLAO|nr:transcriptional regulator [Flavobacterium silvisoli]TBX66122.1 transcriptional regulator [Flavobacterium silvisoli]
MNYIKHLTGFFERVIQDKTLNPTHVSLYISLFQFWNCNRFKNPISISRDEVMRISKISSKATYHKCLKNLHALGYIKYEPSYNPFRGSHVIMYNFAEDLKPQSKTSSKNEPSFEPISKQVQNRQETSTEQAIVPFINSRNSSNNKNESKPAHSNLNENESTEEVFKKEKSSAKKEKENMTLSEVESPALEKVVDYFKQQKFEATEAQKFYNYYASNGWLIGGKAPMVDWQAAAQNWINKTFIFNQKPNAIQLSKTNHLSTSIEKNYAEPL